MPIKSKICIQFVKNRIYVINVHTNNTHITLQSRQRYDSESNHESIQNQMFFCLSQSWFESKNGEANWVMSQSESIPGEYTRVRNWLWVNSRKAIWVMSQINSNLWDTARVTSWFESRHLSQMSKKIVKTADSSYWVMTGIESTFQIVFWVISRFESKLCEVFVFESWVDLNQTL